MDRVGVTGVRLDAFASNKMPDLPHTGILV